eukprot:tig00001668_g9548.t1
MGSNASRSRHSGSERESGSGDRGGRRGHSSAANGGNGPGVHPPAGGAAQAPAGGPVPYPLPHQYYNGLYSGQPFLVGGHRLIPANQLPSFFLEGIRPDLAFLPFQQQPRIPQPPPPQMQHTCTIRNDVNLKKNSLKLVRDEANPNLYRVEFQFDAATECTVTVFFVAVETTEANSPATYKCVYDNRQPHTRTFPKGLGQFYAQAADEGVNVALFKEDDLIFTPGPNANQYPVVIRLETLAGSSSDSSSEGRSGVQSQSTFATLAKLPEGGWGIKVLKQKILVGGVSYELQEIYGIEQNAEGDGGEAADSGRECVICMSEPRDTTLLPCRHMCMCNECAKVLRYQTNKCPICRSPVESLLQIKVSKKDGPGSGGPSG